MGETYLGLDAAVNSIKAPWWKWLLVRAFGEKTIVRDMDSIGLGSETILELRKYKGKMYLIDYKRQPRKYGFAGAVGLGGSIPNTSKQSPLAQALEEKKKCSK